ncbi:MAG: DUF308 domain-containing protein [Anaerolineae bacterium]|nr:DUF308 domain-containing protein [Anaerolineae bacterium]
MAQSSRPQVPWWLVLVEGISLLILGALLLISPGMTTIIVVRFVGIYWLIAGIFKIISIFMDRSGWGWKLAGGILGIIAGLMVMGQPLVAPLIVGASLVIILAVQGIVFGVISLVQAFQGGGWGAGIFGVISILFGFLFLSNVWGYTLALPWAIGVMAIVGGVIAIVNAFRLR